MADNSGLKDRGTVLGIVHDVRHHRAGADVPAGRDIPDGDADAGRPGGAALRLRRADFSLSTDGAPQVADMKRPLDRYAAKRTFTRTPEPAPKLADGAQRAAAVRRAEARGAASALRLPARARWRAQVMGRAKGPSLEPGEKRLAVEIGGPSVRLRLVRGRDPGEAIRRRQRDRVGLRRVFAG